MSSRQREGGPRAMIEAPMRPSAGVMALAALCGRAKPRLMVAVLVAALTGRRQFQTRAARSMARLALDASMDADKRKMRLARMIVAPFDPVTGRVTGSALRIDAKAALMDHVRMAFLTSRGRIPV